MGEVAQGGGEGGLSEVEVFALSWEARRKKVSEVPRLWPAKKYGRDAPKSSPRPSTFATTTMAAPTTIQDVPKTPKDARRKRKAKDTSTSQHEAKRIRTQDEETAAAGAKQANSETTLAIVGYNGEQAANSEGGEAVKNKIKLRPDKGSWYTSEPAGGRFLQIDPIFSKDERYEAEPCCF